MQLFYSLANDSSTYLYALLNTGICFQINCRHEKILSICLRYLLLRPEKFTGR